jgi:hypothetical protein
MRATTRPTSRSSRHRSTDIDVSLAFAAARSCRCSLGNLASCDGNFLPHRLAVSDGPDIAPVTEIDHNQGLVLCEQWLDVLGVERLWLRQRRIIGELSGEDGFKIATLLGDCSSTLPDPLLGGGIVLRRPLGDLGNDRLLELSCFRSKVLVLAHELSEQIIAGGKSCGQ